MTEQVKILFLSANPKDISRIRLEQEMRDVDEGIRLGEYCDQLKLIFQPAARPRDIRRALLRYKPHILHFSGHGSATAGIVLEDDSGNTKMLSTDALAGLLGVIKDNLRIVLLNACYSAVQADAIGKVIDFTIGMRKEIGDRSAIVFSVAFYDGLAGGRSVKESFGLGVNALQSEGIPETETPTLLVKEGADSARTYLVSPRELRPDAEKPGEERPREGHNVKWQANATTGDIVQTGIGGDVRTDTLHIGPNNK
ncbi:MAG: CHAT domain-containing protein [Pyrinomonadaceae bacterium]